MTTSERSSLPTAALVSLVSLVSLTAACGGDATGPDGRVSLYDVGLAAGESATYAADGGVLALDFPSTSGGREYRLAVQTAATDVPDQSVPMRLVLGDGGSASASVSGSRRASGPATAAGAWAGDLLVRQRIRADSRRRLVRDGVRPARFSGASYDPDIRTSSMLPSGGPPSEGDTLRFWFPAKEDFSTTCDTDSAETVTAVVERVGQRAAIVQDTAAPDPSVIGDGGGFTSTDFREISAAFDTLVVPTDSAYFGSPTDIDANERVYILFTPRVNELDGTNTRVGGFFVPQDLADSGDSDKDGTGSVCRASNEAEVLYLRAPDGNGDYGNVTTPDQARRNALSVSSHELQHLLNAGNRVIKQGGTFGDLETTWLSEALSHVAEEAVGLAALNVPVRSNLTWSETGGTSSTTFETYLWNNFYNAGLAMRESPGVLALAADDPQGTGSLEMRGFGWLFVRWLTDHRTSADGTVPGSGEESLIRDLAQADGGLESGVANVEGATGVAFEDLLADFALMMTLDDDVEGAGGTQVLPTWDLRNMYSQLAAGYSRFQNDFGQYPLEPVEAGFTGRTVDFELRPGAGKHFILSADGPISEVRLELTDPAGEALAADTRARIVAFRVR